MNKLLPIIFLLPSLAFADSKFDLCEITGYFQGNQERFLEDLASFHLYEDGFIADSQCDILRQSGFKTGSKQSGPWSESELKTIQKANYFKKRVLTSTLKSSGIVVK